MKKYHYVYRITNLKPFDERKYYIGVRSSICLPEQDTDYMSSSKSLKKIILEQPKENFKKEILTIWKNREEAVAEEIRLHNNFDVGNNRIFYNKAKQTSVSFSFDPSGLKKSKEHRKNLSKAILKKFEEDPSYKKRLSDITKKWHETNINPFKGKKHTLEARKKMSENHADFRKEKHPLWGTSPSKEARKKMSEAKKGKGFKPKTSKKIILILLK